MTPHEHHIQEHPVLSFERYGVAFHFVDRTPGPPDRIRSSPEFSSFERDLVSYAYREEPPFGTRILPVPDAIRHVEIQYPAELSYVSEGLEIRLVCADADPARGRRRAVDVHASRTDFRSGLSVFHLVLSPGAATDAARLNEYDLVKLIKLWEGGEGVGVDSSLRIDRRVTFLSKDGDLLTIEDMAGRTLGLRDAHTRQPRLGTVQVITGDAAAPPGSVDWNTVWHVIRAFKSSSPGDASPDDLHTNAVKGVAGVMQGLLDFDRVGPSELSDVFGSVHVADGLLIAIHKGTLVSIAASDRAFDAAPFVGISPYLLAPAAVLAHNEECLRKASDASDEAASTTLRVLDGARRTMHQGLDRDPLPNIFHYPTERMIYTVGEESRGLRDQQLALRGKLSEIRSELQAITERRRRTAEDVMGGLLLILSGITLKDMLPLSIVLPVFSLGAMAYVYWRLRT